MYVRALYDYDADDRTSLSFRRGDVIQVITQLESGWWDGVINGVRGWFPSNYCQVVNGPVEDVVSRTNGHDEVDDDGEYEDIDDYDPEEDKDGNDATALPIEGVEDHDQEEAAFWIPQATPDGRLYYFNTLTGVSTMELPLETPSASNETGPRDRNHVYIPESTRRPPELMAGGYERDEDTDNENSDIEPRSAVEVTDGALVGLLYILCARALTRNCSPSGTNPDPISPTPTTPSKLPCPPWVPP